MSDKFVPNAKRHLYVSLAKSGLRLIGYVFICVIPTPIALVAGIILISSEVLGVVEELV